MPAVARTDPYAFPRSFRMVSAMLAARENAPPVHPERVRQLHASAMRKLRAALADVYSEVCDHAVGEEAVAPQKRAGGAA